MTSLRASRVHLADRGLLAVGLAERGISTRLVWRYRNVRGAFQYPAESQSFGERCSFACDANAAHWGRTGTTFASSQ